MRTLFDKIIQFQNHSESDFKNSKSIQTFTRFILAYGLFMISTLLAFITIPFRFALREIKKKATKHKIYKLTKSNIETICKSEPLLLLDFWADWCGPCIIMDPILVEFMETNTDISIGKVNADFNPEILRHYKVKGLPQFILLKNGEEVKRNAGPMTLSELHHFVYN